MTSTKYWHAIFHPHVHFCPTPALIWSYNNTVSLSSDASIYSQYKLKTELFFSQSINVLKVNKQAKHINVKITV